MMSIAYLALFMPLISFIFFLCTSSFLPRKAVSYIACGSILASFCLFVTLLFHYLNSNEAMNFKLFSWIPVQSINADFAIHIDSLSLLMSMIITGIGFLIHVYSTGYMEHEADYLRYFACLNFFIFAMLILVLADNLILLFVGWEGVGLASYLLIGYDYYRKKAAQAATKAFVVNRVGDFGLLLGLLLTFTTFGTSNISEILSRINEYPVAAPVITAIALLYFVGACGKSAQLPLQVWLADAMEGPTPVSALIHAATMVTAGVYLVVRMNSLYIHAPLALEVIGIIGALTAIYAALSAVGQTELKRVLAYSTVSQLGFMFVACGAKAFYAAMFHLTMHAFIKALLFLSAGNVLYRLHGVADMQEMGGLRKKMPVTSWFFLIGALALSGIPPLAAFFSKDLILEQAHLKGHDILFDIALIASALTAFYMMRAYCLVFTGKSRLGPKFVNEPKGDAPKVMLIPVAILMIFSIFGGFLGASFNSIPPLVSFLSPIGISPSEVELTSHFHFSLAVAMALIGGLIGLITALFLYTRPYESLSNTFSVLYKAFYFDELYDLLFVRPLNALSRVLSYFFEPKIFKGSIDRTSRGAIVTAALMQNMQSGQIRSYVAWIAFAAAFLLLYILSLTGTGVF